MQPNNISRLIAYLVCLILLTLSSFELTHAAPSPLIIKSAKYNTKTKILTVKTNTRKGLTGVLQLLHGDGGLLANQTLSTAHQTFNIPLANLGQPPCSVVATINSLTVSKKVIGAPSSCLKVPSCKIVTPTSPLNAQIKDTLNFVGNVTVKDKTALPLSYEWDFAGGVFDNSHPKTLEVKDIKFVRDNSSYRVRFAATDTQNRRCEAAVQVNIGTLPDNLPSKVEEQPAPIRGGEANGQEGDLVVLPFQEWSMQHTSDSRQNPNGYDSFNHLFNSLNAHVIEKGSVGTVNKPKFVVDNQIQLRYSAASNPLDPVGTSSINSTSQNWPLNSDTSKPAPMMAAATSIQKTDIWETHPTRPAETISSSYTNRSAVQAIFAWWGLDSVTDGLPIPDEGYFPHGNTAPIEGQDSYDYYLGVFNNLNAINPEGVKHGRFMPGISAPYIKNDPQPFPFFNIDQQWFNASAIPITDVDDSGRVNPNALMRIEAVRKSTGAVEAKTDTVLSTSRDFHCRECHAKGQIAANPNAGYKADAFLSSPKGQDQDPFYVSNRDPNLHLTKPVFYDAESDSLFDQEYAAALNYASLHDFYDGYDFAGQMQKGGGSLWGFHNGPAEGDLPHKCNGCHSTAPEVTYRGESLWDAAPYDNTNLYYNPDYSMSMHRFHGELQYNDDKSDILRNEKGAYKRFDYKDKTSRTANKNLNPNTLFPIFAADGKQLPMQENCLKCHSGHREQLYNDRMATAGVTCYDCHGDMLAMGRAFPKDSAKSGSKNRADYRVAWFDQTDCGSCHSGKGSAPVRTTAFDSTDLSAKTRPVDKTNSNAVRFAVVPNYEKELPAFTYSWDALANAGAGEEIYNEDPIKINAPLYRFGKDQHANIACAACHGAAHAVGPNRDPKSNDNLTSIQLQGYPGPITECNVCHTQDAFNTEDSIGSASHYPNGNDENPTILAGPHNMHPVNDPNWWKQRDGGAANQTQSKVNGGWHSVWAKKGGTYDEDQCASCHGADHKGTRLSKVPVDREFTTGKSKKYKKISVKAGTAVGCDLCHSLDQSKIGKPTGSVPEPATNGGSTNKPPKITSTSSKGLNVNESYTYTVVASDANKDALTFSLTDNPNNLNFDPNSHIVTYTPSKGGSFSFTVSVSDGKGGIATQTNKVTVCTPPLHWMASHGHCM